MRFIFLYLFFATITFANCPDSATSTASINDIKSNYNSEDELLSTELESILEHLKENNKIEKNIYNIDSDVKKLHTFSPLELKEIEVIINRINNLIHEQR